MDNCEHNLLLGVENATARWQVDTAMITYNLISSAGVFQTQAKKAIATLNTATENKEWS